MKNLIHFLIVKSDIFGQPISLKMNGEPTFKTFVGGILTISFAIGLIVTFFLLSRDIFDKTNPSVILESEILYPRNPTHLTKETMGIAFGLTDEATGIINKPEYFVLKAEIYNNQNLAGGSLTRTQLPIRRCIPDDFPQISEESFHNVALDAMYCIDNQNVTIYGYWDEPVLQFLSLELFYCTNETTTNTCADFSEIHSYTKIQELSFNIFLVDSMIHPDIYLNPITYNIVNKFKGIRSDTQKFAEIFIKNDTLISDNGLVTPNINSLFSLSYDYLEPDDAEITDKMCLFEVSIVSSSLHNTIFRTYPRITNVLVSLGGLSSVFAFLIRFLLYYFNEIKINTEILNKVFDYDLEEQQKVVDSSELVGIYKRESSIKIKDLHKVENSMFLHGNIPIKKLNRNNNINAEGHSQIESNIKLTPSFNLTYIPRSPMQNHDVSSKHFNTNLPNYNKEKYNQVLINQIINSSSQRYGLVFTSCQLVMLLLCPCLKKKRLRHKYLLYKLSKKKLNQIIDVKNVMEKIEELEKLKIILMSNQQLALFNFLSNDIISLSDSKTNEINRIKEFIGDKEKSAMTVLHMVQEFNKDPENNKPSDLDKKMMELLNDEFKNAILK